MKKLMALFRREGDIEIGANYAGQKGNESAGPEKGIPGKNGRSEDDSGELDGQRFRGENPPLIADRAISHFNFAK